MRTIRNEDVDGLVEPHNLEGDLASQFSEIKVGSCDEHHSENDRDCAVESEESV